MDKSSIIQDYRWASPPFGMVWLWVLTGILVAAALAGVLYYRRRQIKFAAEMVEPKRPAHEVALESLEKLLGLMQEERYQEFVVEVSRLLRVYIQDRYDVRAPHRSTEEFLVEASEDIRITPEHRSILADFLHRCDLVKFARRQVLLNHMKALYQTAKAFVETTTAKPTTEVTANL